MRLALWLTGNKRAQAWTEKEEKTTVYELKAYVNNIFARLGIDAKKLKFENSENDLFDNSLNINSLENINLGVFGMVSQKTLKQTDIEQEVFFAELNWEAVMMQQSQRRDAVQDLPKYPEVRRDLALLLDKAVDFAEIEKIAYETERKLLKKVTLFDVYEGKNIAAGQKSYAISFILQDKDKTLNDSQIEGIMQELLHNFETKLQAKLR